MLATPSFPLSMVLSDPAAVAAPSAGVVASYSCAPGYTASAAATMNVVCDKGQWRVAAAGAIATIPTESSCVANPCSPLQSDHGAFSPASGTTGTTSTLTCAAGYFALATTTTCEANGLWSGTLPSEGQPIAPVSCQPVVCTLAQGVLHGSTVFGKLQAYVGESIGFECDAGYELQGAASLSCVQSADLASPVGFWSASVPVCVAKSCPSLAAPAGGPISW